MAAPPAEKTLIFEDHALKAFFSPGGSDFMIVTFGDLITPVKSDRFFADVSVGKASMACIGIVAKGGNWYPRPSMGELLAGIQDRLVGYQERVLYGGSMGGYAALKFSRALRATTVIALCPQWSLDAVECGRDPGWQEYFHEDMQGMGIMHEDVSGNVFVFSDVFDKQDLFHVERIKNVSSSVVAINVPFVGHDITSVFAGTAHLVELVECCRKRDTQSLRRMSRDLRRFSSPRVRHLLNRALAKHPWFLKIRSHDDRLITEWAERCLTRSQREFYSQALQLGAGGGDSDPSNADGLLHRFDKIGILSTVHGTRLIFNRTANCVFHGVVTDPAVETAVNFGLFDDDKIVLFVEQEDGRLLLRHAQGRIVAACDADRSFACATFTIEEASTRGFVSLRLGDRFLCAVQSLGDVYCDRATASSWEQFQMQEGGTSQNGSAIS